MQREMKEKKMTNAPAQGLYKTTDVDHKALGDQSAYGKAFFSLANVLIEKMMRDDYAAFKKKVAACVRKSQED
ncbi:unnamed protein product [Toxocara canis]|uniref:DUF4296 domain-containing protein n=1 Tax=Toxocara canis TaxID=6265 RepID=A0A183VGW5_TOXCA|nr:unnamed protein product [Toxocara canis]